MNNNSIVHKILSSSKYKEINPGTIENVYISLSHKKDVESDVRSKLHQIWGAYYSTRPNFRKLLKKLEAGEISLEDLVSIHSSTKEREKDFRLVFDYIFSNIGNNLSILDIGCGLNPIFFLLNEYSFSEYQCVDIDSAQQSFLNEIFENKKMVAKVGDALLDKFEYFDCVFAFKLLPVLDQISKEKCNEFLSELKCKYLVVSFPNKSLGGREKGMQTNYQEMYVPRLNELGYELKSDQKFLNESVYIFEKQNRA